MSLATHPVSQFLANTENEVNFHIDDEALEKLMSQDDLRPKDDLFAHILSPARVIKTGDSDRLTPVMERTGTLTSRIYTLLEEVHGCVLQSDFRKKAECHPAFDLIRRELRQAYMMSKLDEKFDQIDRTGAVCVFDKARALVTIGFNLTAMRGNIRESKAMVDLRHARLIDRINNPDKPMFDIDHDRKKLEPVLETSTTFYLNISVGFKI